MKVASFSVRGRESFGIVEGDSIKDLGGLGASDLKGAIAANSLPEFASKAKQAPSMSLKDIQWLPVIPNPDKILCIGLNYEEHRQETGRPEQTYPTIFTRFANSQAGHLTNMIRPKQSDQFDYEGELAVIMGKPGRHISEANAFAHVAGYSCYNDGSVRDWQRHTSQFIPGKNFPMTGAFGPWMVTADEVPDVTKLSLKTLLNGNVMQQAGLHQLIFSIPRLISYCSAFTPLAPGDVIVTGTPGGVGFKRNPPVYMKPGDKIDIEISGVGTLSNGIEIEA